MEKYYIILNSGFMEPVSRNQRGYKVIKLLIGDGGKSQSKFPTERNDCTVRALVYYLDKPYDQIHNSASKYRNNGKTMPYNYTQLLFEENGLYIEFLYPRLTVNQFIKRNPNKNCIIRINRHVFTFKNGMIYDSGKPGLKSKIDYIAYIISK